MCSNKEKSSYTVTQQELLVIYLCPSKSVNDRQTNERTFKPLFLQAQASHVTLQPDCDIPSDVFKKSKCKNVFPQRQRVLIVEQYLISRSYLTYQKELRDKIADSFAPNIIRTVTTALCTSNSLQELFTGLHQT